MSKIRVQLHYSISVHIFFKKDNLWYVHILIIYGLTDILILLPYLMKILLREQYH